MLIDDWMIQGIFFYIFALIAIISAIMVTVSRNTVHSVFFLILDFVSISCLFIMSGAEFLGMIMLIVYVGAVAVLFLFVVIVVTWSLLIIVDIFGYLLVDNCFYLLVFVDICCYLLISVDICWYFLIFVDIC